MRYDFILFDADDTLFDFQATAKKCFLETSKSFGLPSNDENYYLYRDINQNLWDEYSLGKIEKKVIIKLRFSIYGEKIGKTIDPDAFAKIYEEKLSKTSILLPETVTTLQRLKSLNTKLYLITNGTKHVQRGRLALSGIEGFFDGIFISDEMGCSKPSSKYLEIVENSIKGFDRKRALICGDSLVSDIPLGTNNGIDTCFFNPNGISTVENVNYTYNIKSLSEIIKIIKN